MTEGQLELLRSATRGRRPKPPEGVAGHQPVARVLVDVPLPHLDRPFDYLVPESMADGAQPGTRVRVRFAGQDVEGFVLERVDASDHEGRLSRITRLVSPEPVLTTEVAALCRAVADRYAGGMSDVVRLAVPPRHARVEKEPSGSAEPAPAAEGTQDDGRVDDGRVDDGRVDDGRVDDGRVDDGRVDDGGAWAAYPAGPALLARLAAGEAPRAVWTALAGADHWTTCVADAVAATVRSGRGAVVVVPDARDVDRLDAALAARLGTSPDGMPRHVRLTADLGPAPRYRAFLRLARGQVRVAIGTRAAAFAPVRGLGLTVIWDDGEDTHAEPRAPYPHAREVLALRAALTGAGVVAGAWSRTAETQAWLRSGWAREVSADRAGVRAAWPRIEVAATAAGAEEDPSAAGRVPAAAWRAVRAGLARGPVLVQVPRSGYLPALSCQQCRMPARCTTCHGPLGLSHGPRGADADGQGSPRCRWCDRAATGWTCVHCGGRRLRARSVGVQRTAEELGRAFPGVPVVVPAPGHESPSVPPGALVVSTPGLEPAPTQGGYAAAVLLDAQLLLERADLRSSEDALRRWLAAAALVRPAGDGGQVVVCADPQARAVQALVRVDPGLHAERDLDERAELGFPPAVSMASLTGAPEAVQHLAGIVRLPEGAETLGPIPVDGAAPGGEQQVRLLFRLPRRAGADLARELHAAAAVRSAARERAAVRIEVDPERIG